MPWRDCADSSETKLLADTIFYQINLFSWAGSKTSCADLEGDRRSGLPEKSQKYRVS